MNRPQKIIAMIGAGLIVTAAVPGAAVGADALKEVVVRNTASEPVPVAGTVEVGNSSPIPVSGSVSVDDAGPMPVKQVAPVPFQRDLRLVGFDGESDQGRDSFSVPEGKLLTIEFLTLQDSGLPEQILSANIHITPDNSRNFVLEVVPQANNGEIVSQSVKVYAEGGESVTVWVRMSAPPGQTGIPGALSGTLSDMPATP